MSLQLTLARAELRLAAEDWAGHLRHCPLCTAASRARDWERLCRAGAACRTRSCEAARAVEREREADKAPVPGQEPLF